MIMEQEQILNKALPYVADSRMNHMSFELLFGNYNISEKNEIIQILADHQIYITKQMTAAQNTSFEKTVMALVQPFLYKNKLTDQNYLKIFGHITGNKQAEVLSIIGKNDIIIECIGDQYESLKTYFTSIKEELLHAHVTVAYYESKIDHYYRVSHNKVEMYEILQLLRKDKRLSHEDMKHIRNFVINHHIVDQYDAQLKSDEAISLKEYLKNYYTLTNSTLSLKGLLKKISRYLKSAIEKDVILIYAHDHGIIKDDIKWLRHDKANGDNYYIAVRINQLRNAVKRNQPMPTQDEYFDRLLADVHISDDAIDMIMAYVKEYQLLKDDQSDMRHQVVDTYSQVKEAYKISQLIYKDAIPASQRSLSGLLKMLDETSLNQYYRGNIIFSANQIHVIEPLYFPEHCKNEDIYTIAKQVQAYADKQKINLEDVVRKDLRNNARLSEVVIRAIIKNLKSRHLIEDVTENGQTDLDEEKLEDFLLDDFTDLLNQNEENDSMSIIFANPNITETNEVLCIEIQKGNKQAEADLCEKNKALVYSCALKYQYFLNNNLEIADLFIVGVEGMLKAAYKFDITKGCRFTTYATWWIRQSMLRMICDEGFLIRISVHTMEKIVKMIALERNVEVAGMNEKEARQYICQEMEIDNEKLDELLDLRTNVLHINSTDAFISDNQQILLGDTLADEKNDIEKQIYNNQLTEALDQLIGTLTEREAQIIICRYGLRGHKVETLEEIGQRYHVTRERIRQIEMKALGKLSTIKAKRQLIDFYEDFKG
jgi:RNA polymerase primary sigma factor